MAPALLAALAWAVATKPEAALVLPHVDAQDVLALRRNMDSEVLLSADAQDALRERKVASEPEPELTQPILGLRGSRLVSEMLSAEAEKPQQQLQRRRPQPLKVVQQQQQQQPKGRQNPQRAVTSQAALPAASHAKGALSRTDARMPKLRQAQTLASDSSGDGDAYIHPLNPDVDWKSEIAAETQKMSPPSPPPLPPSKDASQPSAAQTSSLDTNCVSAGIYSALMDGTAFGVVFTAKASSGTGFRFGKLPSTLIYGQALGVSLVVLTVVLAASIALAFFGQRAALAHRTCCPPACRRRKRLHVCPSRCRTRPIPSHRSLTLTLNLCLHFLP